MPRIIDEQMKQPRNVGASTNKFILDTLRLIENEIRFEVVRVFGCYSSLLSYVLIKSDHKEMAEKVPSIPLFLELGASGKTMISLMSLGLSRTTAMILADKAPRQDFTPAEALEWIRKNGTDGLYLSLFLREEIENIITINNTVI